MPDLTGIPALDLAIGLAFIFLLLSLLASTIQESVAALLGLRARTLEEGVRNMLKGEGGARDLVNQFYAHPLIDSLYRGDTPPQPAAPDAGRLARARRSVRRTHGPSYVSPRAFAAFVLDNVTPADGATTLADLQAGIETLPVPVQRRLAPLVKAARDDVDAFRQGVEAWYDDTMARVSGWYKRKSQMILLVIGAVLVLALNANTLTIAERLWSDQTVRAAVVQQANQAGSQPKGDVPQERLKSAADDVANLAKLGVPLGWSGEAKPKWDGTAWITTLGGWLLTILAISLGAPFWFDTLGRLSRLRSSGKPETPLPATGSGKPNERVVT